MDYIIDFKPVIMDEINYAYIKEIEERIKSKFSLSNEEIIIFLDSVCYSVRNNVNEKMDNFDYKCDLFQSILYYYFKDLNCEVIPCMTQNVITNDIVGHSFLIVKIFVNEEYRYYLLDPSYIQFFNKEKCQTSKYFINPNYPHQILLTPDPGFFIKDDKIEIATYLCNHGYIILNEDTAQMYGDSFFNTKVGVQRIDYQSIPGSIYVKSFLRGNEKLSKNEEELKELGLVVFKKNEVYKK